MIEINTNNDLKHKFYPAKTNGFISFRVRASNDAHIALTTTKNVSNPITEIFIGGWGNRKSAIRRNRQSHEKIMVETPNILQHDEFRGFWMRWNGGLVSLGKEGQDDPIMSWNDPDPFDIRFFGICTGFGSTGRWKLDDILPNPKLSTGRISKYIYYPATLNGRISFKVQTKNEIHIALTSTADDSSQITEILLGGWNNTKSSIRRNHQSNDQIIVETPNILDDNEYRCFWMHWNGGFIAIGKEDQNDSFMSWNDPKPFEIKLFGIYTANNCIWELENITPNPYISPGKLLKHIYYPTTSNGCISFRVRANNDVHIALSTTADVSSPITEIIIGGWSNKKSAIRRNRQSQEQVFIDTPNILDPNEYRSFWMRWNGGLVAIGKEGQENPLMSWNDPAPFDIRLFGIYTAHGVIASWKFEDILPNPHIKTGPIPRHIYYPVTSNGCVSFRVRCANDVHLALAPIADQSSPVTELFIGGWGNTKSAIRRNRESEERVFIETPNILNAYEFRGFWVRWNGGYVALGKEGHDNPLMAWNNPAPFAINLFGIFTAYNAVGSWKIGNILPNPHIITGSIPRHIYYPVTSNGYVSFRVRCANDVHLALAPSADPSSPVTELFIGGWGNTKSAIRRNRESEERVFIETPNILNSNEFRGFWVRWNGGYAVLGKEGHDNPLMAWNNPAPFAINLFGIFTAYNAVGSWEIGNILPAPPANDGLIKYISPPNDLKHLHRAPSNGFVSFRIRAAGEVNFSLMSTTDISSPITEIFIGGWGNMKSSIRNNRLSEDKVIVDTPNILNPDEYRGFWVRWNVGEVAFGKEGQKNSLMSWKDPKPFIVKLFGIYTGFGPTGSWKIVKISPYSIENEISTTNNLKYIFNPATSKGFLSFRVQASNDCHVALTTTADNSNPITEIILGGFGNTKSMIRRNRLSDDKTVVETPNILNRGEYRGFWMRWSCGLIAIGREGQDDAFMSWKDPEPFDVRFYGISTGTNVIGNWKMDKISQNSIENEISTENNMRYTFYEAIKNGFLSFRVRASNNACVALTMTKDALNPIIEFIIGSSTNTKSVIRRNRQSQEQIIVETPNILHSNEYRGFWVRWNNGYVAMGKEGQNVPFMSWKDPNPFDVKFLGICTDNGVVGSWKMETISPNPDEEVGLNADDPKYVSTDDDLKHKFYPATSDGFISFKVRASNDAHIALTTTKNVSNPITEIFIGGWFNTKSAIRSNRQSHEEVIVNTPNILNANEYRGFWIRWNDGDVEMGKEGQDNALMSWNNPEPFDIKWFGICTGFGAKGSWKLGQISPNQNKNNISTGNDLKYVFYPALNGIISFKVQASNDAHIALTTLKDISNPIAEVILGGWKNTQSAIRRDRQLPDQVTVQTPNILNRDEYIGFWIKWNKGYISVGMENDEDPFMSWKDPQPFNIEYFGVCTGYGSTGNWIFQNEGSIDIR